MSRSDPDDEQTNEEGVNPAKDARARDGDAYGESMGESS